MAKIIDIYYNANPIQPNSTLEELIFECFHYGIFKEKPSKKHKEWFKEFFDVSYPIDEEELTNSLIKTLKSVIKGKKKDEAFDKKMSNQRAKRCYADIDVWNWNSWFANITAAMFKDMAKHHIGHPLIDEEGNYVKQNGPSYEKIYNTDKCNDKWTEILERISFLSSELNEETCSWHAELNRLTEQWWAYHEQFKKEYNNGNSLKSEEELAYEKDNNVRIIVFPDRHPNKEFVKNYNKANKELRTFKKKLFTYQNKCKNELFDLLKKYYWDLWD